MSLVRLPSAPLGLGLPSGPRRGLLPSREVPGLFSGALFEPVWPGAGVFWAFAPGCPGGFSPGLGALAPGCPGGFSPGLGAFAPGCPGGFSPGLGALAPGCPGGFSPPACPGGFPPGLGALAPGCPGGFSPGLEALAPGCPGGGWHPAAPVLQVWGHWHPAVPADFLRAWVGLKARPGPGCYRPSAAWSRTRCAVGRSRLEAGSGLRAGSRVRR